MVAKIVIEFECASEIIFRISGRCDDHGSGRIGAGSDIGGG